MPDYHTSSEVDSPAPIGSMTGGDHVGSQVFQSLLDLLQTWEAPPVSAASTSALLDPASDGDPIEWSEEDVVLLHWRLLKELRRLADPETPLAEKFDTLRWVLAEREKYDRPFSFVSCLRVVGCSPFSPLPYCGLVDVEVVRDSVCSAMKAWFHQTLMRYPLWVREAVAERPEWVEARLARNPQWLNEEVRRVALEGDLFV